MRFSATILDVNAFKEMLRALAVVNKEATLTFTPEGISSEVMDVEHITLVEWLLDKNLLSGYDYEDGTKITPDMENLMKFMDGFSKGDSLSLSLDAESNRLNIKGRGDAAKGMGRLKSFSVPLLDLVEDEVPKPRLFFKSMARLVSSTLVEALKDASLVGENVALHIEETGITVDAAGDLGSAVNVWERGADELIELKVEEPSKAHFLLEKLKAIATQGARCGEVAHIQLSTDMPMRINFEMGMGKLTYHLAPLVGN